VKAAWAYRDNIFPAITFLGNNEFEVKDAASREATMMVMGFTIAALRRAKTNLAYKQQLIL
jgi:hypothetical protein